MVRRTLLLVAALAALSLAASPAFAELDKATASKVQRLETLAEAGSFDAVVKAARDMLKDADGEARDVFTFHLARALQRTRANAEAVGLLIPMVVAGGPMAVDAAEVLKLAGSELPDEDVDIDAAVAGASVLVDGDDVGTTPASFKLKPGVYKVEVAKAGFVSAGTTLVVKPGQGSTFDADLKATGGPMPKSEPVAPRTFAVLKLAGADGAEVLVDGKPVPVENGAVKLEAGDHKVRVEKKGFHPVEASVTAAPGRDLSGSADLVAVGGKSALTPYLWTGLGVGGAMVVAATLVGSFASLDSVTNDAVLGGVGGAGVLLFAGCGYFLKTDYDAVHNPQVHENGLKVSVLPSSSGLTLGVAGSF